MGDAIRLRDEVFYKEKEIKLNGRSILTFGSEIEIDGITHWFEFIIYYGGNKDKVDGNLISTIIYHNMLQYNINNSGNFKNDFTEAMEVIYDNIAYALSYHNEYELVSIKVDKERKY